MEETKLSYQERCIKLMLVREDWEGIRKRVLEGLRITAKIIPIVRSRK